jgi:hypothetical protein
MARRAPRSRIVDPDPETTSRDFVMARLAAAHASAQAAIDAIEDALVMFVNVDDDASGKKRRDLIGAALEAIGAGTRALECAEENYEHVDAKEGEPWEADQYEDDDDDDDEG